MRTHHAATLLAAATVLALTACDPQTTDTSKPAPAAPAVTTPAAPATTAAAPVPASSAPAAPAPAAPAATATVPNMVGKILQAAQDESQALGFYLLGSTDALGKSRMQVLDRNWKVCSQTPAAGTQAPTSTKLVFNTVKVEEACP